MATHIGAMEPTALLLAGAMFVATTIAKEAADDLAKGAWGRIKDVLRPLLGREPLPADLSIARVESAVAKVPQAREAVLGLWETTPVLRRARAVESALTGAHALWVDDSPAGNTLERQLLAAMGVRVTTVESTRSALDCLARERFDLLISDIDRDGDARAGLDALPKLRAAAPDLAVIFYILRVEPRGVPHGAFGITARPDELLHLCLDALERRRL